MRRRISCTVSAVLALALLTACGGVSSNGIESKSPDEVLTAAKSAASGAKSVRLVGSFTAGRAPLSLDLTLAAGKGARGEISEHGLSFQVIALGNDVYIYGSRAFYEHFGGKAAAQLFQGKWLKAPANSGEFASLASLTNMQAVLGGLLKNNGALKAAGTTKLEGRTVLGITGSAEGGTLYVATTGKPFPVAAVKSGSGGGKLIFSDWNAPVSIEAPANAIDIEALEHT